MRSIRNWKPAINISLSKKSSYTKHFTNSLYCRPVEDASQLSPFSGTELGRYELTERHLEFTKTMLLYPH
jgi:hypothetical protein